MKRREKFLQANEQTNKQSNEETNEQTNEETNKQTRKQTNKQTNKRGKKKIELDRQIIKRNETRKDKQNKTRQSKETLGKNRQAVQINFLEMRHRNLIENEEKIKNSWKLIGNTKIKVYKIMKQKIKNKNNFIPASSKN